MRRGARILVVDDDPGMVRAVERVLGEAHDVVGRQSSADALALAREFQPDLAILDVRMPEVDGFALMGRLKAELPHVDIILMTGSLDDLDQKLIRAIRGRAFYFIQKPFDREVLQTLVDRCLELRWRREENRRHVHRLETELAEARAFQQGLLPVRDVVTDEVAISCRYVSCSELGGDLCDHVSVAPGRVAVLIADVMGHGVSAAMLTGVVKSAFRTAEADGYEPSAVVRRLRGSMASFGPERFVTLIAAIISTEEQQVVYVNAGHPPGLLLNTEDGVQRLESTGPLVSTALPICAWEQRRLPMSTGDLLVLFTDGVSDTLATEDDMGEEAILAASRAHVGGGPPLLESILARVWERLGSRPQPDDLTLLSAKMLDRPRPGSSGRVLPTGDRTLI
ncbi:MAG TPA: SpoIIE family protein phosphatase [Vicinamibacterales bacterium]|nr:SpoIIE family protein phosphatase [Vicinamibacterales bacterium]